MLNLRFASLFSGTFLLSRIRDAMNMDMPLGHHLSENFFVPRCFFLPLQDSRTSLCLVLVLSFFVSSHLEVSSSFAFLSPRVFSSFRKLVFWGFLCHAPFCLFCPRPFQQRHFLQDHALGAKSCRSSGQRLQIINNMP